MIKLIATDLDETFLHRDKTYNRDLLVDVLAQARTQNVIFTIATGNTVDRIERLFGSLINDMALVANNGGQVVYQGENLFLGEINTDAVNQITRHMNQTKYPLHHGIVLNTEHGEYMPINQRHLLQSYYRAKRYFSSLKLIQHVENLPEPVLKAVAHVDFGDVSSNIKFQREAEFINDLQEQIGPQIHVTTAGFGAIDMIRHDVNKANGLRILSKKLGIAPEQMAAFGDGKNDIEMLKFVGSGYRMPNSDPKLREYDFVEAIADNNHDGVLKTIQTFLTLPK